MSNNRVLVADKGPEFKKTLREHREALRSNECDPYTADLKRCEGTLVKHLKKIDIYKPLTLHRISKSDFPDVVERIVSLIFKAPKFRPFLYIKSDLPLCWNAVPHWDKNYIVYEWGHFNSVNQNGDEAHSTENLALHCQRGNQHIQSSMDIDELLVYGGKIEEVIVTNKDAREKLFKSPEWLSVLDDLTLICLPFLGDL